MSPRLLLAIVVLAFPPLVFAQPKSPPPHIDPVNRLVWSDSELGIRFTYPPVWQKGNPTQDATVAVINWRLKTSKSLLATCYVEVHAPPKSKVATLKPAEIHGAARSIAQSALKNMQERAPDAELLTWTPVIQDGYPAVYVIRTGTVETYDRRNRLKLYSLVTSWRNHEINFECGTPVFGADYANREGGAQLIEQVELGIKNVMRTLQFDRVTSR